MEDNKQENEAVLIKGDVKFAWQMFPKGKKPIMNGDFGIISVKVENLTEGTVKKSKYGTIVLTGDMCEINKDESYKIVANEEMSEKFGLQYKILSIRTDIKLESINDQRIFLGKVLSEKQCDDMFSTYENPVEILEKGDVEALCKIKGIGVPTAQKLIAKYESCKDFSEIYIKLDKYGLTNNAIKKLMDRYGSPSAVVTKVEANPYMLIDEVAGIGWDKADKLSLKGGMDEYSVERVTAYIKYYLDDEANSGNTWCWTDNLLENIDGMIGYDLPQETLVESLKKLKDTKIIWTNEEQDIIALYKNYNLEKNVAKELKRLNEAENKFEVGNWEEKVELLEKRQGWEFTNEQRYGIKTILENQVVLVQGLAGCVDCDTEFFTGYEWKKISEYKVGDLVLQYNEDRSSNLIKPTRYLKLPCEEMTHLKTTRGGINQVLSDEHTFVYLSNNNKLNKKPFSEIKKKHLELKRGFYGSIITSFDFHKEGIKLSDEEIRIMIAIFADGSFPNENYNLCRLHLTKERKIKRAVELLVDAKIPYTIQNKLTNRQLESLLFLMHQ